MPKPKAQANAPASKITRELSPPKAALPPPPPPPTKRELFAAVQARVNATHELLSTHQAFQDVMCAKQPGMEGALWTQLPGAPAFGVTITLPTEIRERFTEAEAAFVERVLEQVTLNSMGAIAEQAWADLQASVDQVLTLAEQSAAGTA